MVTLTHTPTPATGGQVRQLARVAADAAENAVKDHKGLSKEGAQRVQENPEFAACINRAVAAALAELSITDRYADEEAKSSFAYPKEYADIGPRSIEDQIAELAKMLGLDPTEALEHAKSLPELPAGAEGWFAIPSDSGLQKLFPDIGDAAERYCAGVRLVLEKIAASRKFKNWRDGQIVPERLRVHVRTAEALKTLAESQPGDILIVAAQLGMRHRGRSIRRARECFDANEFGLGALAIGSIILTHPERLVRWEELEPDCPGDEFDDPGASVRFGQAPIFDFSDGRVFFDTEWFDRADASYGSVSAFLPQS